jgi:flavin-dependent dehydrogenase
MNRSYDVVVVGAGPAEAGLSTLLIEKRQQIGVPVRCAEAIGEDLVKGFIDLDERWIDARISHFKVHNSLGEGVALPPAEPTLVVNRILFDYQLALLAARAGAEVVTSACAESVIVEDGAVRGVRLRHVEQAHEIRARLVVAADGSESQVARWAGLKTAPKAGDYYTAAEFLLAGMATYITPTICEYHLNHELAPGGYLWAFPKGADSANVGLVIPVHLHSAGLCMAAPFCGPALPQDEHHGGDHRRHPGQRGAETHGDGWIGGGGGCGAPGRPDDGGGDQPGDDRRGPGDAGCDSRAAGRGGERKTPAGV